MTAGPFGADGFKLGNYWWKIARRQDGTLDFTREPTPFFPDRVSDRAATQASFPPDARLPYTFGTTSGGFGQSRQDSNEETDRFYYAGATDGNTDQGTDASAGNLTHLAPLVTRGTLSSFTPTDGYLFALGTGWFLAATDATNTRVYKWNTGTLAWDLQATITSRVVSDAAVFQGTLTVGTDYAYLAFGASQNMKYSTDGVTWTDVTTSAKAEKLVRIDSELWKVLSSTVTKCTDGGTTCTFAGPIDIGTATGTVNGLYNHADRLNIGKNVGLYVLAADRATLDQNLCSDLLRNGPDSATFSGGITWRNHLITPYLGGLRAISPDYAAVPVGWDRYADNDSPVYGAPTGLAADAYHLYATCASGYLLKGVAVMESGVITDVKWFPLLYFGTNAVRAGVWNGATGGAPEWYGLLANGQTVRFILPVTGNPLTDSRCRFCPAGIQVRPLYYGGHITQDKVTFSLEADAKTLSTNQTVRYAYRPPTTTTFTSVTQTQTTLPGTRNDLGTPLQARAIQVRETFTTNDSTATPVLRSTTIAYLVQVDPLPTLKVTLDLIQGAYLADGSQQYLEPSIASQRLFDMVNSGVKSTLDPWGRSLDVTIPLDGLKEIGGKPHQDREPDLLVQVMCRGQLQRTRGTWDRAYQLTWNEAALLTWDQLKAVA